MDIEIEPQSSAKKAIRNGNGKRRQSVMSCISKDLYDEPPHSDSIVLQLFYNIIHRSFIILSKIRLGQILISILDYYMIKIENTLDFCLPDNCGFASQRVIDKQKKSLPIQDRPMSWIFFIPVLIILRILRFVLSIYCIIAGTGEVTAQQMQGKVIEFRRYYRSIRHYAVDKWTDDDKILINGRKEWLLWRLYYRIYESIFMTKQIVEVHELNGDDREKRMINGRDKGSLNVSLANPDDEDSKTNELLEECEEIEDSLTSDQDYENSKILEETADSDDSSEEDEDEYESQMKHDGKNIKLNNQHTSGHDITDDQNQGSDKSNDENFLTPTQLNNLENEIMKKLLNHFKETMKFNSPSTNDFSNEVFYSPIGSPLDDGTVLHTTENKESFTTEQQTETSGTEVQKPIIKEAHAAEADGQ